MSLMPFNTGGDQQRATVTWNQLVAMNPQGAGQPRLGRHGLGRINGSLRPKDEGRGFGLHIFCPVCFNLTAAPVTAQSLCSMSVLCSPVRPSDCSWEFYFR